MRKQQLFILANFLLVFSFTIQAQSAKEHFENGTIKFRLKKYDQALIEFSKAIELKPDYADAYYFRGLVKSTIKDTSAKSEFTKVIQLEPNNAKAYNYRGMLYLREKRIEESIPDFDKAIQIKPNYEDPYFNKGMAYLEMKKFEESIVQLNKAIELKPDYISAFYGRALSEYLSKNYPASIADFNKTAQLDSVYSIKLYYFRGDAKMKTGDKVGACADFKKSLDAGYKDAGEMLEKYCN